MKPQPTPPCRLSLVFASEAPVAVVLRRGPTDWVELIKWDTSTDTFEHGQWLHGRIFGERCGLSPDGRLFVYFAAKDGLRSQPGKQVEGYKPTFTAVSRPPYFTALAMWPEGSTYGGGGRFIDNKTLCLGYGAPPPDPYRRLAYGSPLPHHPGHPPGPLNIYSGIDYYAADRDFRCDPEGYPEADWTGKDHGARRIFTRAGILYALEPDQRERKAKKQRSRRRAPGADLALSGQERMLKDFNPDVPRRLISPAWAQKWEEKWEPPARRRNTGGTR